MAADEAEFCRRQEEERRAGKNVEHELSMNKQKVRACLVCEAYEMQQLNEDTRTNIWAPAYVCKWIMYIYMYLYMYIYLTHAGTYIHTYVQTSQRRKSILSGPGEAPARRGGEEAEARAGVAQDIRR